MTDLELHEFYENLVRTLRSKRVLCAITSGLAFGRYPDETATSPLVDRRPVV